MYGIDKYPVVKLVDLQKAFKGSDKGLAIAQLVFKVGSDGMCELRASKPKNSMKLHFNLRKYIGEAQYVWRNVAFLVSPNSKHHCMPVMAEFDLPGHPLYEGKSYFDLSEDEKIMIRLWEKQRKNELKTIEDMIVNLIPKAEWHGVHRWGRALGNW